MQQVAVILPARGFPGINRRCVGPQLRKRLGHPAPVKHPAIDGVVDRQPVLPFYHQARQPQLYLGGAAVVGNAALLHNLAVEAQQAIGPLLVAQNAVLNGAQVGRVVVRLPVIDQVSLHQVGHFFGADCRQQLGGRGGLYHPIAQLLGEKRLPPGVVQNLRQHRLRIPYYSSQPISQGLCLRQRKGVST